MPDALYFRVSSDRQTTENQFEDVVSFYNQSHKGSSPAEIPAETLLYRLRASVKEVPSPTPQNPSRSVFKADPTIVEALAFSYIYVEQGKSAKTRSGQRPLFERMKRDAAAGRFDRVLVWKVSRFGRDMREILATVHELADLGVTVVPVKSNTGPITSSMGKLLWAIMAWFAEMENEEKIEAVRAGMKRAKREGKSLGRPRRLFDREKVRDLRRQGYPILRIAREMGVPETTVRRALSS